MPFCPVWLSFLGDPLFSKEEKEGEWIWRRGEVGRGARRVERGETVVGMCCMREKYVLNSKKKVIKVKLFILLCTE